MIQEVDLGFTPRKWQDEVFRNLARFSVLVVHRRGGKTVAAVLKLIHEALKCGKPRGRYGYIAPELKQAKGIAWDFLKHYAAKVPHAKINESELWVEFPNEARIRIYGADNPNSLRGLYFDGVVLDEVAQMKPDVWGEIILPALLDRNGWVLFIGTPNGMNLFSDLFTQGTNLQHTPGSDWFARLYNVYETGALTEEQIEATKQEMTPRQFRQEMMCDFSASGDDILITLEQAQEAAKRVVKHDDVAFAQMRIGVDVARQGGDRTVLFARKGLRAGPYGILQNADSISIATRVIAAKAKLKSEMEIFDDTGGYGAGPIDVLRSHGYAPIGINFSVKPDDRRYFNKRAEMWFRLRNWLVNGGSIPDAPQLIKELTCQTYTTKDGRLILHPKEVIKEKIGHSPDMADALALTFAFQDVPKEMPLPLISVPSESARSAFEYDPLETKYDERPRHED